MDFLKAELFPGDPPGPEKDTPAEPGSFEGPGGVGGGRRPAPGEGAEGALTTPEAKASGPQPTSQPPSITEKIRLINELRKKFDSYVYRKGQERAGTAENPPQALGDPSQGPQAPGGGNFIYNSGQYGLRFEDGPEGGPGEESPETAGAGSQPNPSNP